MTKYKTLLLALICFDSCIGSYLLESQSVFYGLTLSAERNGAGSKCSQELVRTGEGTRNNERWALKLLDASGAPRTGLYWGNTFWLGSRKQCLASANTDEVFINPSIQPYTHETPDTISPFPVAYFVGYFFHNSTFQTFIHKDNENMVSLGLCLPDSCTEVEVYDFLLQYFESGVLTHHRLYNMHFTMEAVKKTREKSVWMNHPLSICFTITFWLASLLQMTSTLYDWWFNKPEQGLKQSHNNTNNIFERLGSINGINNSVLQNGCNVLKTVSNNTKVSTRNKLERIFLSFSWYTNVAQIFTLTPAPGTLVALSGLRFFLTSGVIFFHASLFLSDYFQNRVFGYLILENLTSQIYLNSTYFIDTFFFLGGFLVILTLSKTEDKLGEKQTNWSLLKYFIRGIFKRYRRLTPVYFFILILTFTLYTDRSNVSPFWTNERNDIQCAKYWWTNLLYINNLFPGTYSSMCMSWSYYLANDMQFFIVISFLFFLSKKFFKTAVTLLAGILIASISVTAILTYIEDYKPYADNFLITAPIFYYPPWMRVGPYIVGVCYGYLYTKLNGKLQIKKIYRTLLWIASISMVVYLMFGFSDRNLPLYSSILHTSLAKNAFVVAVGWMILACLTGHGGAMNTFLSAKAWLPFSHFSYVAYLLNPVVIHLIATDNETPWEINDVNALVMGLGFILFTYLISVLVVMGIEIPVEKIFKIMLEENKTAELTDKPNQQGSVQNKVFHKKYQ